MGQGFLIVEVSRSHSHTVHSAGFLWTNDEQRPLPDKTQHSQEANIHAPSDIQNRIRSNWVAANPRLQPRLHQFRQEIVPRRIYVPGNTKWIPRYSVKCSIFVSDFNRICIFWTDFYNKYPASNVLGIRPVEAVLINTDGQTDGHRNVTKLVGTFRHYANAPKKVSRRIGSYILPNIKEVSLGLNLIIFF